MLYVACPHRLKLLIAVLMRKMIGGQGTIKTIPSSFDRVGYFWEVPVISVNEHVKRWLFDQLAGQGTTETLNWWTRICLKKYIAVSKGRSY